MELKSVIITEVHWSIGWNASQQANDRLKEKLGPELSKCFATLKVGNASYNWLTDTIAQWRPMGTAPADVKLLIAKQAEQVRQAVFERLADNENLATKICQVPNYEEYIFYKKEGDALDIIITGWGFHNFKRAGHFVETWPPMPAMHNTTIAFTVDGERQPGRIFSVVTPKMKKQYTTDEQGLQTFTEYAGVSITVIDEATQRRFTFTTADEDTTQEFDVTEEKEVVVDPPIEEGGGEEEEVVVTPPDPITTARLHVIDLQGQPMAGARYLLRQGEKTAEGMLDEQGSATFVKSNFTLGQPLQATITPPDQHVIAPTDFQLEERENDYVLQEQAPKAGSRWLEILMFILLLLCLALLLIFVFEPGIKDLTYTINHKLF